MAHSFILLCSPTGAKRNVPLELLVSGALSAVTATTEVNVHRPQVPVSVSLATRALAARSGYAPRACMAQAAPCPVPVTLRTLSGMICGQVSLGQGLDGPQDGERLPGLWLHLQSGQSAARVRTDLRSSASCSPRSAAWALQRVSLKPHIGITHRNGGLELDGSGGQGGLG